MVGGALPCGANLVTQALLQVSHGILHLVFIKTTEVENLQSWRQARLASYKKAFKGRNPGSVMLDKFLRQRGFVLIPQKIWSGVIIMPGKTLAGISAKNPPSHFLKAISLP